MEALKQNVVINIKFFQKFIVFILWKKIRVQFNRLIDRLIGTLLVKTSRLVGENTVEMFYRYGVHFFSSLLM